MRPPAAGLRPIWHNANSAKRVEIVVAAGAILHVPADVADQLHRADPHFQPLPDTTTTVRDDDTVTTAVPESAVPVVQNTDSLPPPRRRRRTEA